jgi:hypothetical protein
MDRMNLLVQMGTLVEAAWRGRSGFYRPSLFGEPAAERQSRFWATVIAVMVTLFALGLAAGAVYLLWSAFTIHERHLR